MFTIIAHVNLKQENIPFKRLIAQVILDVSKQEECDTQIITICTRKIKRSRVW